MEKVDESRRGRDEGAGFFDAGEERMGCGVWISDRINWRRDSRFFAGLLGCASTAGRFNAVGVSVLT